MVKYCITQFKVIIMSDKILSSIIAAVATITAATIAGIISYRISRNGDRTKLKISHELEIMEIIIKPLHNKDSYTQISKKKFSEVINDIKWLKNLFDKYYTWLPLVLIDKMDKLIEHVEAWEAGPNANDSTLQKNIKKKYRDVFYCLWRYEKQVRHDVGAPTGGTYDAIKYTLGTPMYYIILIGMLIVCWVTIVFVALEYNNMPVAIIAFVIPYVALVITCVVKWLWKKYYREKYAKSSAQKSD